MINKINIFVGRGKTIPVNSIKEAEKINQKLLKKLEFHGGFMNRLLGVRNGVAFLESPFKTNFGTTIERKAVCLDENDALKVIKSKSLYKYDHAGEKNRAVWILDQLPNGQFIKTSRSSQSVNGELLSVRTRKVKANDNQSDMFYETFENTIYDLNLDPKHGLYYEYKKHPYDHLGCTTVIGRLINNDGHYDYIPRKRVTQTPNIGLITRHFDVDA